MAEQHPTSDHHYPHEGHLEPLSPGMLADDLVKHPDAYHPVLVTNHITPYLAKNGIDLSDMSLDENDAELARKVMHKLREWKEGDPPFTNMEAYLLIDEERYGAIAQNLDKFISLHPYIAGVLIERHFAQFVAQHPEAFSSFDMTLICELLEAGYGELVLSRLDQFGDLTTESLCDKLLEDGKAWVVLHNRNLFTGMSQYDIARKFIEHSQADRLAENLGLFKDLDADIAYDLLDLAHARTVLMNLDVFRDLDHDRLARILLELDYDDLVARYIRVLYGLSEEVASTLIVNGYGATVIAHMTRFLHVDQQFLVDELINSMSVRAIIDNIEALTQINHTTIVINIILHGNAPVALDYLDKFTALDYERILDALWNQKTFGPVWIAKFIDKFPGVDRTQIAERLIASDNAAEIAKNIDNFPEVNHSRLVDILIDNHCSELVLRNLEKFTDVDEMKVLTRILKMDVTYMSALPSAQLSKLRNNEEFVALVAHEVPQLFTNNVVPEEILENAYPDIVAVVGSGKNEIIDLNTELFAVGAGAMSARMLYAILRGSEVPEYAQELGITQVGPEAIEQLRVLMKPILKEIDSCNFSEATEREIVNSELLSRLLAGYTGFTDSEWGESGTKELKRKLKYRLQAQEDGRIEELRAGYEPSEVYKITTTGSKETEHEARFSEDAVDRYKVLVGDLAAARSVLDGRLGFGNAISELRRGISMVVNGLQRDLGTVDEEDPKAEFKRKNLESRIDSLMKYLEVSSDSSKRFVLNSPADFERGIVELAKYPELHSGIRSLTFAWAMRKNLQAAERVRDLPEQPTIEALSSVREFIEHIVNQETYGHYFSNKKSISIFRRITSTKALEEAMLRYNLRASQGGSTTTVQFVPTRGALMEMSGQIADACWADKYESIAEEFPNFTAVMIRARPGRANERLIGGALLIETKDPKTGEGVLLLRGTNPRENYINKVDVGSFYDSITDFVRKTAERRGLRPAIVIDDHSGGSGTNRPVLHGYFMAKLSELKRQRVDNATTYFNGYDVTDESYAL